MKQYVKLLIIAFIVGACHSQPNVPLETRITICPENFVNLGSHCYYFSQEVANVWDQAWELCRELDDRSVLVNIDSITKWHHIRNYLKEKKLASFFWWIGGTDREKDGEWVWMGSNQPFPFAEWCPGEPNGSGNEACAHIELYNGTICWNDLNCSTHPYQMHFVCEA